MKILILCGVFAKENEEEIIKNATAPVEFSANLFQERLIGGFNALENIEVSVLSAPFIGAYPTGSKIKNFKSFKVSQEKYRYVPFCNIWGIRNFSRTASLKKSIKAFAKDGCEKKLIVVYCTHTPFIKAAEYAKKLDPKIKICLYVPDLPQYMNLSENRGFIYNVAKKYDIASMTKHMKCIDTFVLLTKHMKDKLPVEDKPYRVIEGIFDFIPSISNEAENSVSEKYIVYTGKLDKKFGAVSLVDSMRHMNDESLRLVLCGSGDSFEYAKAESEKDRRIIPLGQVTPKVAEEWRRKASVLVNPRPNSEEYTKYSFPSKNVEYLLSGKPTVAYMLDGMPDIYRDFIYEINHDGEASHAIAKAIENALSEKIEKGNAYYEYAKEKLSATQIATQILKLNYGRG
ncbi:MAG: glycosyltransferase family 4 protein [Ruminococcaceae bacterium]|nr:glycosyltransferase family 4 protein [Oscillospiraceae bacterium]